MTKRIYHRRPAEEDRDRKNIARLYLQGMIQAEIAHELKLSQSTISRELKVLAEEWKKDRAYDINEAKAKELAKLDNLEVEYWDAWKRSQRDAIIESEGSNFQGSFNKTTKQNQYGDSRFLDGVMNCIKQRCTILGVEAPKRIINEPPDNINWDDLTPDQIARIRNVKDVGEIKEIINDKSSRKS